MADRKMHIAAAANKAFLKCLYVMLVSVFSSNPGEEICLYILNTDFDDEDKRLFYDLAKEHGASLCFPAVPKERFEKGLPTCEAITIETYYRVILPEILPDAVGKALYLDCDIVVHGPIRELWETDLGDCLFAACPDPGAATLDHVHKSELFRDMAGAQDFTYVNAGVLLFNLDGLRREVRAEDIIRTGVEMADKLLYHDQDILNYMFRGRIKLLSNERYNLMARNAFNSGLTYDHVSKNNVILHYAGPKPWAGNEVHYELERFWWDHARLTPFYTKLLEDIVLYEVNTNYYDKLYRDLKAENDKLREINSRCMELVNRMKEETENQKPEKTTGRLVLFIGVYDTLDIFMYELRDEFVKLGYEIMLFDSSKMEQSLAELGGFIDKPVTAALTFNNLGYNMELVPGKNTWDELNIPMINILMDHPFSHKSALDASPKQGIVLVVDRLHLKYLSRFYPQIAITGFLPHGGKMLRGPVKAVSDRSIDIIYAGGISYGFIKDLMPDFSTFDFDAEGIAERAKQMLLDDNSLTTEDAIEKALVENGINLTDDVLVDVIDKLRYIECYVVSYYREKLIRTLVMSGLKVVLYGSGWEVCDWLDDPCLDFRGRTSAYEIVDIMQDAKIVLSTMTWFKDGTHDRVFNGMLAGAVAVTDSSVYMREEFGGDELVMFELSEIDELPDKIKSILNNMDEMQAIADNGRKKALEKHTWQCRARELHEDLLSQLH